MNQEQINRAAVAFNAMLFYEIGAADYAENSPHDHCDANIVLLAAVSHVMGCDEDKAFEIVTNAGQDLHLGDVIQAAAESLRLA